MPPNPGQPDPSALVARPTVVVSDPRELVALVPYRLGFRPRESLVLMSLRRPAEGSPQVGLVVRVDLPPSDRSGCLADADPRTDPDDRAWQDGEGAPVPASEAVSQLVAHLGGHLARDGADGAVLVVYADEPVCACLPAVVDDELAALGVELADAWQVDERSFRSLTCRDPGCCPPDGWPLSVLDAMRVSAEMVALGRGVVATRGDLAGDLRPVDDDRRARVARHVAALRRRSSASTPGSPGATSTVRRRRAALAAWRTACRADGAVDGVGAGPETDGVEAEAGWVTGAAEVPERQAALLLLALQDPLVRDAVLLDCVPGARGAADASVRGDDDAGALARVLDGVFGGGPGAPVPHEETLRRAEAVLRSLVRQTDGALQAAPLGLLAWAAWWAGDGGRAAVVLDLALAVDPQHRLALLVRSALDAGYAPGWARTGPAVSQSGTDLSTG